MQLHCFKMQFCCMKMRFYCILSKCSCILTYAVVLYCTKLQLYCIKIQLYCIKTQLNCIVGLLFQSLRLLSETYLPSLLVIRWSTCHGMHRLTSAEEPIFATGSNALDVETASPTFPLRHSSTQRGMQHYCLFLHSINID